MIFQIKRAAKDLEQRVLMGVRGICREGRKKDEGIDGILVTVGLCVIALLLCVVMKDSLSDFITTIINELTLEAKNILGKTS
ncbi:MAG: hypothetical protein NC081_04255 [Roseburia sp.]|nr:hypothetical protein [Roseburia sp.]